MKKVLALVLAVVLAFGMTTVAFAKTTYYGLNVDNGTWYLADDGKVVDTKNVNTSNTPTLVPGKTYYIPVVAATSSVSTDEAKKVVLDSGKATDDTSRTEKVSDLGNYKLSYSIDDGKNMVDSIKFVSMKNKSNVKGLYIAVTIKDNYIIDDVDVNMTITVTAKNGDTAIEGRTSQNNNTNDVLEFDFNGNAQYNNNEDNDVTNGYLTVNDDGSVLSFDEDADDVTLLFKEDVEVAGNMKGQKDVFVRLDTSNTAIEDKYPDATVRFFSGDKDTFRREVTVTMPYDTTVMKPYLYAVDAKGNLTKLIGGETAAKEATEKDISFDATEGSFTFKTTTLGNYVLSDTELKGNINDNTNTDADAPAEGDKPTDGAQPNPGTGANDFVGLAVALAVVSVAGIAVAKRK